MSTSRGGSSLSYRRLGRAEFGAVEALEFEPVCRFLEPLPEILAFVRRGVAHSLIGIAAAEKLVGFYAVHPDRRDRSCWWLGWLAIDRRSQGLGYGRMAVVTAMARLRAISGCRRVRLLVAPENDAAVALYRRAGFAPVDVWPSTGEIVMQCMLEGAAVATHCVKVVVLVANRIKVLSVRLWLRLVPPAAEMSGEHHGPPAGAWA